MLKLVNITSMLIVLLLFSCKENAVVDESSKDQGDSNEITITQEQFRKMDMKWGKVSDQNFYTSITMNGIVDLPPTAIALVSPSIAGFVKDMKLIHSQHVNKGELLLTIENAEFIEMQQSFLELKSQLDYLKSEYERYKTLSNENVSSKKEFLKAESEYRLADTRYNVLKKKLAFIHIDYAKLTAENIVTSIPIYAPINGYITEINVAKGQYIDQNFVMLKISDTNDIHVEINVLEKDINGIKVGQMVEYTMAYSDQTYKAKVVHIGKEVDELSKTIMVHCEPEDNEKLMPGMYVNAKILLNEHPSQALPESAVISTGEQAYVLIKKGEKNGDIVLLKIPVNVLARANSYMAIDTDSLKGKDVLIEGAYNLVSED